MIFGTPITWFIAEVLSAVLFILCIIHAAKQEHGIIRVLTLLGFILYSAMFENVGVYTHIYDYNLNRVMLIGTVPIEILMVEAVIFYATLCIAEHLHIPKWGLPFVVGFLSSFQDMSLDPAAVFDLHLLDGVMSGQWNWTAHYANNFFGIPFFNFSGWMYLMAFYVFALEVGRWIYNKKKKEGFGLAYPFLAVIVAFLLLVSPLVRFLLFAEPFAPMYTRTAELIMLIINFGVGLFILLRFMKVDRPFDLKKNAVVYIVPIVLHIYDLIMAFTLGLQNVIIPVVVVSLLHFVFLAFVFFRGKKFAGSSDRPAVA